MIKLRKQSFALIGTFIAVLQPAFTANSQESNSEFSKLQSLLEAKKWYEGVGIGFQASPRLFNQKSKIKNLKSIVGRAKPRLPRRSRDGISSIASTLQSKIKNLKSIVGRAKPRLPRRSREGISSIASTLQSKIKNQKSIDD